MQNPSDYAAFFAAHPAVWIGLAAVVGACMASFGGVVVDRLPRRAWRKNPDPDASLLTPSRCNSCSAPIGPVALIPVAGWLCYRGRCPQCGSGVPAIYPLIEAATALVSAAWAAQFGATAAGCAGLLLIWGCMVLAWIDWREAWLPDRIMVPLLLTGLLASPFEHDPQARIEGLVMSTIVIGFCFAFLSWRRKQAMSSGGDLMFCAMAGAWLGFHDVPAFLLCSSVFSILGYVPQSVSSWRWKPASPDVAEYLHDTFGDEPGLPMGPALCLALITCLWLGPAVALG